MKVIAFIVFVLLSVHAQAADTFLVVPNRLDNPGGGNSLDWPFTFADSGITSRRYQQVFDASQFTRIESEGGYIKEVWFRPDMLIGQIAHDFLDTVEISLGVTARSPDGLSPFFADNVGPAYMSVYGPSSLEILTLPSWAAIHLVQPFLYLPSTGNLLIDIRTVDSSAYPSADRRLDAGDTLGDAVSAVIANDVNSTSGVSTTRGLVTGFLIEPIPEPSTWALLGLGLVGMWRFAVRRNQQQRQTNRNTRGKYGK